MSEIIKSIKLLVLTETYLMTKSLITNITSKRSDSIMTSPQMNL